MKLRKVRTVLSHTCLVVSLMIVVFFIADRFNPAMEFMSSEMSKWLILFLAIVSFANAVLTIYGIRHAIRKRIEKQQQTETPENDEDLVKTTENEQESTKPKEEDSEDKPCPAAKAQ